MAKTPDSRLKAALRENLKRRKSQARARDEGGDERGKKGTDPAEAGRVGGPASNEGEG